MSHATWLLRGWGTARAVRALVGTDENAYRRLMEPRERRPEQFHTLFGYILGQPLGGSNLGNRYGPASRRSLGCRLGTRAQRQRSDRKERRSDSQPPLQTPGPKVGRRAGPNISRSSSGSNKPHPIGTIGRPKPL